VNRKQKMDMIRHDHELIYCQIIIKRIHLTDIPFRNDSMRQQFDTRFRRTPGDGCPYNDFRKVPSSPLGANRDKIRAALAVIVFFKPICFSLRPLHPHTTGRGASNIWLWVKRGRKIYPRSCSLGMKLSIPE